MLVWLTAWLTVSVQRMSGKGRATVSGGPYTGSKELYSSGSHVHDQFYQIPLLSLSLPVNCVSFAWNGCGDDVAVKLSEVLPQCQKLRRLE